MRSLVLRVAIVALAILALPGWASAQFIPAYTGNTSLLTSPNSNDQGTVSYSVYDNTSGTFASYLAANTGLSAAIAASGASVTSLEADKYIYLYQVSISDKVLLPPDKLYVASPGNFDSSSIGWANGYGFSGVTATTALGDGSSPTITTEGGSMNINTDNPSDQFHPGGSAPAALSYAFATSSNQTYFTALMIGGSNIAPVMGTGQIGDGGYVQGLIPVPGPEPSTMALLGLGLPVFGFGYSRRLRAIAARIVGRKAVAVA